MDGVGDDFDEEFVTKEGADEDARLAVVHRPHGVEDVGDAFQAVVDGLGDLLVGCVGVADFEVDAVHGGIAGDFEGAGDLGEMVMALMQELAWR